jgi:hypothetical protein
MAEKRYGQPVYPTSLLLKRQFLDSTHIPGLRPVGQIVMIYPPLQGHMLPNTDRHILCRCHIDDRRLPRVCIRNPKRDGESVCGAPEGDRECAYEVEEERREAILICWRRMCVRVIVI